MISTFVDGNIVFPVWKIVIPMIRWMKAYFVHFAKETVAARDAWEMKKSSNSEVLLLFLVGTS